MVPEQAKAGVVKQTKTKKWRCAMAKNFKIAVHRNNENIHFRLMGEFDGSSACELLRALKSQWSAGKAFIHTNYLTHIDPFGRSVFQSNLDVTSRQRPLIIFTGDKASQLDPEKPYVF